MTNGQPQRPFEDEIQRFLTYKRGLGFKYDREAGIFCKFQSFCENHGWSGPDLSKEIVDAWCEKLPIEEERGGSGRAMRISLIRQFGDFLSSIGHRAYIPLNVAHNQSRHSKFVAHIFTEDEIARLFEAADRICPHPHSTMHVVMPVLLRLLYSSGTRISETLATQIKDVDLENGVIRLTHTKNNKERLVPLSDSMQGVLSAYCKLVHTDPHPDDYLFCTIYGKPYDKANIYQRFRKLLIDAGIPHGGRGAGPRIHDLRHSFSCHYLLRACKQGIDLYASFPVLSTYLGHDSLRETEKYLQLTAEVYPFLTEKVKAYCSGAIPEVKDNDQASYWLQQASLRLFLPSSQLWEGAEQKHHRLSKNRLLLAAKLL